MWTGDWADGDGDVGCVEGLDVEEVEVAEEDGMDGV